MLAPVFKFLIHHFQCAGMDDKVSHYQQRFQARKRWMNAYRLACVVSSFQTKAGSESENQSENNTDHSPPKATKKILGNQQLRKTTLSPSTIEV